MDESTAPRKRVRVGHVSERAAVNAVRTLLERHELIVMEVDGRADYGRDLMVDVTEGGEVTGVVIGLQVKGDRRYVRASGWALPGYPHGPTLLGSLQRPNPGGAAGPSLRGDALD